MFLTVLPIKFSGGLLIEFHLCIGSESLFSISVPIIKASTQKHVYLFLDFSHARILRGSVRATSQIRFMCCGNPRFFTVFVESPSPSRQTKRCGVWNFSPKFCVTRTFHVFKKSSERCISLVAFRAYHRSHQGALACHILRFSAMVKCIQKRL